MVSWFPRFNDTLRNFSNAVQITCESETAPNFQIIIPYYRALTTGWYWTNWRSFVRNVCWLFIIIFRSFFNIIQRFTWNMPIIFSFCSSYKYSFRSFSLAKCLILSSNNFEFKSCSIWSYFFLTSRSSFNLK